MHVRARGDRMKMMESGGADAGNLRMLSLIPFENTPRDPLFTHTAYGQNRRGGATS